MEPVFPIRDLADRASVYAKLRGQGRRVAAHLWGPQHLGHLFLGQQMLFALLSAHVRAMANAVGGVFLIGFPDKVRRMIIELIAVVVRNDMGGTGARWSERRHDELMHQWPATGASSQADKVALLAGSPNGLKHQQLSSLGAGSSAIDYSLYPPQIADGIGGKLFNLLPSFHANRLSVTNAYVKGNCQRIDRASEDRYRRARNRASTSSWAS